MAEEFFFFGLGPAPERLFFLFQAAQPWSVGVPFPAESVAVHAEDADFMADKGQVGPDFVELGLGQGDAALDLG